MSQQRKLIVATGNTHKRHEIQHILGSEWNVLTLKDFPPLQEIEETGITFAANSEIKALAVSMRFPDSLVIADDSGLCVDALHGEPGVLSARYAGHHATDAKNRDKVRLALQSLGLRASPASFHCVISLAQDGYLIKQFEGTIKGTLQTTETGDQGFGYDPQFYPEGHTLSFANLTPTEKNLISHRAIALSQFRSYIAQT